MKRFRRLVLALSLTGIVVCIVLLLNITAPNPTGRRYSGQQVAIPQSRTDPDEDPGDAGERVLGQDLGAPNNNEAGQRQCLCNVRSQGTPSLCNLCLVSADLITDSYRIPDFVTTHYIAEAKNAAVLYNLEQITDYATGARELGIPLWVYVRVDSIIPPEFVAVVAPTGGAIVPYFVPLGSSYVDPVDQGSKIGLSGFTILFAITGVLEFGGLRTGWPRMPRPPRRKDPMTKASDTVDDLQSFSARSKDRAQRKADREATGGE